jgi:hypothetical protein
VAYGAGLRIAEILNLNPRDIDSPRGLIHVRLGKGNKDGELLPRGAAPEHPRPRAGARGHGGACRQAGREAMWCRAGGRGRARACAEDEAGVSSLGASAAGAAVAGAVRI